MTSPVAQEHLPPAVEVRRLRYEFPGGSVALSDVSFTAAAGERIAIVGPSGAGKSTLLMHLNGLLPDPPARDANLNGNAAVVIAGVAVAAKTVRDVRRIVGFLFQDPDDQLFCPTVGEDIAFGPLNLDLPRDEVRRRLFESLDAVALGREFAGRSTLQLSVGERKRVCLAGVLACQPSILALDEPTANLDPRARRNLLRILGDFPGCQVIATHDLDLVVEHCHRVVLLDRGRVFADGPPRKILADARLMEEHGLEVPLRLLLDAARGGTAERGSGRVSGPNGSSQPHLSTPEGTGQLP